MVAHLVGDDVGLGEVSRRTEAVLQLAEEAEVDVDHRVGRAVERPRPGAAEPAAGVGRLAEQHQLGRFVALPGGGELLLPGLLHVVDEEGHEVDELRLRIERRAQPPIPGRRGCLGNCSKPLSMS